MGELVLRNVSKNYGPVAAVRDVSLSIHDGEFVVFLGPSGCGKTTTLRMIAGLEDVTSGEILLNGQRLNDVAPGDRDIAMVFQNYALYPHMSIYKNMAFGLRMRRVPRREIEIRVERAAQILGIEALLDRYPRQLSGGQRQRVAVGRAIVRDPRVFLFDEPLSNLDAKLRVQTRVELLKLHRRLGATSVYVTHDQVEAMTMGDRIVVMLDGSVQQVAAPIEVYQKPANLFVAGFIGSPSMNFLAGTLTCRNGDARVSGDGFELPLAVSQASRLAPHAGKDVTVGIRPEDLLLRALSRDGGRLAATVDIVEAVGSDIFLDLTLAGASVTARIAATADVRAGQRVELYANPERLHIFDPKSGVNLL